MHDPAAAAYPASNADAWHKPPSATGAPASRALRAVASLLEQVHGETLELRAPGLHRVFGQAVAGAPHAVFVVHDEQVFARVLASGDIGFAEAFIEGQWSTPDLPGLIACFARQRAVLERAVFGSFWGSLAYRLQHLLRRNTRSGSRRNIHAHYDLGNEFYAAWLDQTMNYSSAWFDGDLLQAMPQAQARKVARALDECGVDTGHTVLEIGCGWGAVAEAAGRRGAHLTGVTLSTEQLAWAQRRMAGAGLSTQADLRLQDYRELSAQKKRYDAVVSIEMFEAVGREYWPSYFRTVSDCLAPGGTACIQSIVIAEDLYPRYLRSTDFIQQYIFPGGLLPSVSAFKAEAARAGLVVQRELAFGADYAETLRRWRTAFHAQREVITPLGFDERFMRLWDFYLAYCEAAFDTGQTDVVQFTLRHAG